MLKAIKRLFKDESGQGMVEYALIIGVIVVAIFIALNTTDLGAWISAVVAKLKAHS